MRFLFAQIRFRPCACPGKFLRKDGNEIAHIPRRPSVPMKPFSQESRGKSEFLPRKTGMSRHTRQAATISGNGTEQHPRCPKRNFGKIQAFALNYLSRHLDISSGKRTFAPLSTYRTGCFMVISGCSAVRLAHLLWEQGVVGSNPATPTGKTFFHSKNAVSRKTIKIRIITDGL